MTSGSKSKAQRRAESQQRAAEKRAAELRAKRMRISIRVGGAVVVLAALVFIILNVTGGGSTSVPPSQKNPHVATVAIPASMHTVAPTVGKPGPETVPVV